MALEAVVAAGIGVGASNLRYRKSRGGERQRMQWFGWAAAVGLEVTLIALASRLLSGWPHQGAAIVAAATLPLPLALALGSFPKVMGRVDTLLAHTVSLAGLSGVVIAVYIVIVIGLGHMPTAGERPLLGLSMVAAAVAALLYLPARERLSRFSNRLVYGDKEAPDRALRTFGSRLTRAIPLDELLLQVAGLLRKSMNLAAAEVWTGSEGRFERVVSVPHAPPAAIALSPKEEGVVARAGTPGPAWMKVWLPDLLTGRETSPLRVAPASHSGKLLGLIVAVRHPTEEGFRPEEELVMGELARQVGGGLHTSPSTRPSRPRSTRCDSRPRSCRPPGRASSPPPTRRGARSSATSTTGPSSTSSPSPSTWGWRGGWPRRPGQRRRPCSSSSERT